MEPTRIYLRFDITKDSVLMTQVNERIESADEIFGLGGNPCFYPEIMIFGKANKFYKGIVISMAIHKVNQLIDDSNLLCGHMTYPRINEEE